jgi:hypothetical protein
MAPAPQNEQAMSKDPKLIEYKLMETGERLVFETASVDPATKSRIASSARLILTVDAATGM